MVEGVHRFQAVSLFLADEVIVHRIEHASARSEALVVDIAWQVEVLHGEIAVGRVASQRERRIGTAEIARAGEVGGHAGDAHIGRQVIAWPELVANNAAHAWENKCRIGAIASEHVVGATLMGGLTMGHGPTDSDFVGDLCGLLEMLAQLDAFNLAVDPTHFTPVINGSQRLGIEAVLVGHSTWQEDMNERFGFTFFAGAAAN